MQIVRVTVNGKKAEWKCIPAVGEPVIEVLADKPTERMSRFAGKATSRRRRMPRRGRLRRDVCRSVRRRPAPRGQRPAEEL